MFKEQYIRDNDKLKAKETLLMEIKEKNTREKIALTPKQKFVRYGAVFAAFLLVAVSVFGLITANKPGSAAPQNAALSASADAMAAISTLTDGPQVLVGSSMGGWISLLVARAMPERVAGLVGIAAAPDFTEDGYWAAATPAQREALLRDGRWELPSEYSDAPYVITRHLIEDGRNHLVLRSPLALPFPVRLLQGTADPDVPMDWALRLLDHAQSPDLHLTLVKGADHRFSTPECLGLIEAAIAEVLRG